MISVGSSGTVTSARRALIISQFLETRLALQQTMERSGIFQFVESAHCLEEAKQAILSSASFGHIFIANSYAPQETAELIESIKARSKGRTTFVLLLRSGDQDSQTVANSMVAGFHGFLCEPFSIGAIEESVKLSAAVKSKDSSIRLRTATGLMLTESMPPVDEESGTMNGDLWQRVQETCDRYRHLTGESISVSVVRDLKSLPASQRVPNYNGASKRVRGMFERKLREVVGHLTAPAPLKKDPEE